ncbi:MAG: amidohydrolase family protein [Gammaproteobacteria bacterium]
MRPIAMVSALLLTALAATTAPAQNVVISNARIIVGDGQVIEKGSVVVKDGKIASVTPGGPTVAASGSVRINGTGKTVIAGFIDVHRHLIYGPPDRYFTEQAVDRMRELLEAGFTTVQAGGDDDAAILELKRRVERGEIKGPRILAAARVTTGRLNSDDEVRNAIRAARTAGYDSISEVIFPFAPPPAPPTQKETHNLTVALDEAAKVGIPVQIHAVSPANMVAAVSIGGKKLIHTPHFEWVTEAQADMVKASGAMVSSCTGFGPPVFDVFNHDNKPTFRDGKPWPQGVISNEGQGREGGLLPINGRTLFDRGVVYAYCTDTNFNAMAALNQELKTLNVAFSSLDIIEIMGQSSADFIDRGSQLGTIQTGKIADIVVLGGNPLVGYWNFMTTEVVIKGGAIVLDKRGQPNAGKPMDKPQT